VWQTDHSSSVLLHTAQHSTLFQQYLTFQSLAVTLRTTRFNIKKFYVVPTLRLCVLYGSQNKLRLLFYTALRDWFLQPRCSVHCAVRTGSLYIKQIRFLFKGLIVSNVYHRMVAWLLVAQKRSHVLVAGLVKAIQNSQISMNSFDNIIRFFLCYF
jgi:hypothetical protein